MRLAIASLAAGIRDSKWDTVGALEAAKGICERSEQLEVKQVDVFYQCSTAEM